MQLSYKNDGKIEAGIDEAGRGSFWGPLMAAAVVWFPQEEWEKAHWDIYPQIKDSKKISSKKRKKIAEEIKKLCKGYGLGIVSAEEINQKGIQWANKEAFVRAIRTCPVISERLIIDGLLDNENIPINERICIVDGDDKYLHVAAASILAKVEHDNWIEEYCKIHPECNEKYDIISCKGYGTEKHRKGLHIYGAHIHHRNVFIRNYITEKCLICTTNCQST